MEIMKWCQAHWDELRTAVESRGLGHLIPKGGAAAAAMLADELKTGTARDREGFDPLMRAYSMISTRAMESGSGIVGCPLCYVQRHHDECQQPNCHRATPADWIAGCTDRLADYARELGLI